MSRSRRPTILVTVRYYLPGSRAGGPIRSIANLVEQLGDEFRFKVVCSDRDAGDAGPYPGVITDTWARVGKAEVRYLSPGRQGLASWRRILLEDEFDILYLNSFLDPRYSLAPLLLRRLGIAPTVPVVIAPRGEFSAGALQLKSWKKRPYRAAATRLRLLEGVLWHASTALEAREIRAALSAALVRQEVGHTVHVGPDLVLQPTARWQDCDPPDGDGGTEATNAELLVCYLARISPMKNLAYALKILAQVRHPVVFNIYGPLEAPGYWRECRRLISALPPSLKVRVHGPVPHDQVIPTIGQHDLYFLPTLGENFGHSIVEAWLAGVPVLISDRTPWLGLEAKGIGWDIPLDQPGRYVAALEAASGMTASERHSMRRRCREAAIDITSDGDAINASRELFQRALAMNRECGGGYPDAHK